MPEKFEVQVGDSVTFSHAAHHLRADTISITTRSGSAALPTSDEHKSTTGHRQELTHSMLCPRLILVGHTLHEFIRVYAFDNARTPTHSI